MKIIDDLLSALDLEAPVEDVRQGPYWTAVMTRGCGLAMSVFMPYHHRGEWPVGDAGHLTEKSASDLAQLARSGSTLEAAIGMASATQFNTSHVWQACSIIQSPLSLRRPSQMRAPSSGRPIGPQLLFHAPRPSIGSPILPSRISLMPSR